MCFDAPENQTSFWKLTTRLPTPLFACEVIKPTFTCTPGSLPHLTHGRSAVMCTRLVVASPFKHLFHTVIKTHHQFNCANVIISF